MKKHILDGAMFLQMVTAGYRLLEMNKERVNALNVFPVPDGDTGTNMSLSFTSGINELRNVSGDPALSKLSEALSVGLLMGARGNSGVILSQLFRGFSKAVSKNDQIDVKQFAEALQNGVTTAYKAVVKPVEGTILTVAKESAQAASKAASQSSATILSVMETAHQEAKRSLDRTPNLLPVLKQAGVVDSGGQGLVFIYEGFVRALQGQETDMHDEPIVTGPIPHGMPAPAGAKFEHEAEYGYCTEFLIRWNPQDTQSSEYDKEQALRHTLETLGDSTLVVAAGDLVKIHIHSEHPGNVLEKALQFGSLTRIKIDNMTEQHHNLSQDYHPAQPQPERQEQPFGIVTVVAGDGLAEIFRSVGVEGVIEGGQTMNPSTEDIVKAIREIQADHIFVLPNNSNIIMAAEQARLVIGEERVTIIPSKTIPQGLAATVAFDETRSLEENQQAMVSILNQVQSGQITQAVRDSNFQDFNIKEGDYLGLVEGKVVTVGNELAVTFVQLLEHMVSDESEIVTLFYGEDLTEADAESLMSKVSNVCPQCEVEIHKGGQPLYPLIISVE